MGASSYNPHPETGMLSIIVMKRSAFSKGQTLKMELVNSESIDTRDALKILVEKVKILKGKAIVFHYHILIRDFDANRVRKRCRRYYDHFVSWYESEVNHHGSFGKF